MNDVNDPIEMQNISIDDYKKVKVVDAYLLDYIFAEDDDK